MSYELIVSDPRQVRTLQMLLYYSIAFLVAWLVSSDQPPVVLWPVTALALPLLLWLQWWEHNAIISSNGLKPCCAMTMGNCLLPRMLTTRH